MLILVFHPACATILVFGLKIVEKLHLMKRKESRLKKLEASMEVYQNTAVYLGTHKMVLVNVLAITFCTEVCFICSNMVCIPRLPFIRHFLYHHCAAAGGHFRIG